MKAKKATYIIRIKASILGIYWDNGKELESTILFSMGFEVCGRGQPRPPKFKSQFAGYFQ